MTEPMLVEYRHTQDDTTTISYLWACRTCRTMWASEAFARNCLHPYAHPDGRRRVCPDCVGLPNCHDHEMRAQ